MLVFKCIIHRCRARHDYPYEDTLPPPPFADAAGPAPFPPPPPPPAPASAAAGAGVGVGGGAGPSFALFWNSADAWALVGRGGGSRCSSVSSEARTPPPPDPLRTPLYPFRTRNGPPLMMRSHNHH